MIKIFKRLIFICTVFFFAGCDKDFVEVNTNPYAITAVDPALLFAGAQRTHIGTWNAEHTIVQQFVSLTIQELILALISMRILTVISNPKWDSI